MLVCLVLNPIPFTEGIVNSLVWSSYRHCLCPGPSGCFSAHLLPLSCLEGWPTPSCGSESKGGTSLSQSGYANFREVPAFLSKIAPSSHLTSCLLLCFLPVLSVHRSEQSQTFRKFPLLPCVLSLMPAVCLSGQAAPRRASFTVQR